MTGDPLLYNQKAAVSSPASELAVAVRNVSKMYPLYADPRDRLKQSLWYTLPRFLRGKPRQFYHEFWALRDVSFEVKKGEATGIIGRNGSGKSTLLQIIAGTLSPTWGEVQVNGRVAALLELGSGFNPEFTGRENVYLNGTILGFSREEMDQRFDGIAAFADIGQFLDQPVKLYSSGMFVRLAFAVQVQLDPEILIVDEALAVGDAAFAVKCMNRMKRLIQSGTTILFVTHDVQAVRSLCDRAVWLDKGVVQSIGTPIEVTSQYVQSMFAEETAGSCQIAKAVQEIRSPSSPSSTFEGNMLRLDQRKDLIRWGSGELVVEAVALHDGQSMAEPVFEYGERLHIEFLVKALKDIPSSDVGFGFTFRNNRGLDIINSTTYEEGLRFMPFRSGQMVKVIFEVDNILAPGDYALVLAIEDRTTGINYYDFVENAIVFKVIAKRVIYSLVLPPVSQEVNSVLNGFEE